MKAWIMIVGVMAILAIAGFAVVKAISLSGDAIQTNTEAQTSTSCASCPNGGCTAESNCGLSTCGTRTGGTCACGK